MRRWRARAQLDLSELYSILMPRTMGYSQMCRGGVCSTGFWEHHVMNVRDKLAALGIEVPKLSGPFGAYVPAKRVGSLIYVAGQIPMREGKLTAAGHVPSCCTVEQAREAAKLCVINGLAAVDSLPGRIEQIAGVARVGAFINSDPDFTEQPKVANAASEFLIELFGEAGKHARAAVGVNTLPLDAAVEIEFIFEAR
jgi:enamine deaminase RidA (YjgF/YER057c/UK114 family)